MPKTKKKRSRCGKENKNPEKWPSRPKKHCQLSDESMLGALKAVMDGEMGVNRAVLEFGVPCTTLKDRIAGRVVNGTSIGPKTYLTHEEEQELVDFLFKCSKMGQEVRC